MVLETGSGHTELKELRDGARDKEAKEEGPETSEAILPFFNDLFVSILDQNEIKFLLICNTKEKRHYTQ